MPVVKLTFNDDHYNKLSKMAEEKKVSIQDFIKDKLFHEDTIYTPQEAVIRANDGRFSQGQEFSLPEIYGEEWNLARGFAGVFGKKFYNHVLDHEVGIVFVNMGKNGRLAMYKLTEGGLC